MWKLLLQLDLKQNKSASSSPTGRTGELIKTDHFDMWAGGEYTSKLFCFEYL